MALPCLLIGQLVLVQLRCTVRAITADVMRCADDKYRPLKVTG